MRETLLPGSLPIGLDEARAQRRVRCASGIHSLAFWPALFQIHSLALKTTSPGPAPRLGAALSLSPAARCRLFFPPRGSAPPFYPAPSGSFLIALSRSPCSIPTCWRWRNSRPCSATLRSTWSGLRSRIRCPRMRATMRVTRSRSSKLRACCQVTPTTVMPRSASALRRRVSSAMRSAPVWAASLSYSTARFASGHHRSPR